MGEAYQGGPPGHLALRPLRCLASAQTSCGARPRSCGEARREEILSWLVREADSTRIKASLEWEAVHAVTLEAATLPYLYEGFISIAD
jgi:aldehyde dehydrogenase (NAD+)